MISTTLSSSWKSSTYSRPSCRPGAGGAGRRCGSGKTMLAAQLAWLFPDITVHTDDFYLPQPAVWQTWEQILLRQHGLGASACPGVSPLPGPGRPSPTVPTPAGRVPTCRNNALRLSRWSSWRAVTAATPTFADCCDLKASPAPGKSRPASPLARRENAIPASPRPVDPGWKRVFQKIPDRADR